MSSETTFGIVSLTILVVLYLYAFGGTFFEAKHVFLSYLTYI